MPQSLKLIFALAFAALLTSHTLAQSSTPLSTAVPASSGITLKTNARLVVVDVVVTDKHQQPVHNLKQSDFTLLESNTPQTISHFEEHIYPNPKAQPAAPLPVLPPGFYTNFYPDLPGDSLNIILLDTLNTPLEDQARARERLKTYLKTEKPGIRTAIFGLGTRLVLLQGFTSDPAVLRSILEKKPTSGSILIDNPLSGGDKNAAANQLGDDAKKFTDAMGNGPTEIQIVANLAQIEAMKQSFQLKLRAQYTLDAMNLLARYLSGLPGRKNLIWFSGSFPINVLPNGEKPGGTGGDFFDPFSGVVSSETEFRQTVALLAHAQVAVYPVDARGLITSTAIADVTDRGPQYGRNPAGIAKDDTDFFQQTVAEHGTMTDMAEQTGGRAFVDTNGLTQAVDAAIESGSNFYTLTYAPTDSTSDGKFRKIQIHLQQGLNLAYRRGYYADDPNPKASQPDSASTSAPEKTATIPDPMRIAMMPGGPDPSELLFKARILPAAAASEKSLVPGNAPNPNPKLSHGPYRRYIVDLAADPNSVLFAKASDGHYSESIEIRTYVYDLDGVLINNMIATSSSNIAAADLQSFLKGGIQLHQEISVPTKGTYTLRIGIHDLNGDRLGAIEVPVTAIQNLPPLPAPGTPTPSNPARAPVAPN
jgi:VWFA-related protein